MYLQAKVFSFPKVSCFKSKYLLISNQKLKCWSKWNCETEAKPTDKKTVTIQQMQMLGTKKCIIMLQVQCINKRKCLLVQVAVSHWRH